MSFSGFMLPLIFWCLITFGALSIFLFALSFYFRAHQDRMLYYPDAPSDSTTVCDSPAEYGVTNFEHVHVLTSDGVTLRGFLMWPQTPHTSVEYTIVYFHGNAGNVGHRIPIARLLTARHACAVLMMDYRGFGRSDRVAPTEGGLRLDAQACLEYVWADARLPRGRTFLMGTSLGGAVALHLAAQPAHAPRIAGVILENTFTSISDMVAVLARPVVRHMCPSCAGAALCVFNAYMKPLLLRVGWRSIDVIDRVHVPILFLSGMKDELVPPAQMRQLHARAAKTQRLRRFVEFPEGKHNTVPLLNGYAELIHGFVEEALTQCPAELV